MPCHKNDFNSNSGVYMHTWSGTNSSGTPQHVCTVGGANVARHCVLVENHDTTLKKFRVKGVIAAQPNKAKFSGYAVSSETLWHGESNIDGINQNGTNKGLFDSVEIKQTQNLTGSETISVEVFHQDQWDASKWIRVDRPLVRPLNFDVTVI